MGRQHAAVHEQAGRGSDRVGALEAGRVGLAAARIRLGGAGSYAIPASDSEKLLVGQKLTDELVASAGAAPMKRRAS